MTALRALLGGIVDYAGLFPPAALDMATSVRNYAAYRADTDAWMLGRFVVPVARLDEFSESLAAVPSEEWRVSALLGADVEADVERVRLFNQAHGGRARIDSLEAKLGTTDAISRAGSIVAGACELFVELPLDADLPGLVAAVRRAGAKAKIRTGGVVPDAVPSPESVVRFIRACLNERVAFKATAGLHHPVRADYRMTYDADSPVGVMFGYLNVFLTAAFMAHGVSDAEAVHIVDERDASTFAVAADGFLWRSRFLSTEQADQVRRRVATSFGSCSFREPVDELRALALV